MNTQAQVNNSASPADQPLKRKRGRPRKDESIVQVENIPAAESIKKDKQCADTTAIVGNEMVGQVVSGVIEGSFDAGYLLKVKVGDTDTNLRGVVFLPGRFTPITASNDVAPEAKMYKRTEMPIPVQNPPAPASGLVPPSEHCEKQAVEVQNLAPIVQVQGLTSELQSTNPIVPENQPASGILPLTDNLPPMSSMGSPLRSKVAPQQMPELELKSSSASVMPQMEHEKVAEVNEVQKEFKASTTITPSIDVEAIVQSKPMAQSAPSVDGYPGSGTVNLELQIQHQAAGNDLKPSKPDHDGVKIQNLEQNQVPAIAETVIVSAQPIGINWMEKSASPRRPAVPELSVEFISGNSTSQFNGKADNYAANLTEAESKCTSMTGLPVTLFEREAIGSAPNLTNEGSPLHRMIEPQLCISSGATNFKKADSATVAGLPVTLFERDPITSGPKVASDGPVLPRIVEPQFCSSSGVGANVERNLKDAIPPA